MSLIGKLSALKVAKLTATGRYGDGGGLWLQISTSGTKAWIFRYTVAGRARQMGLGPIGDVTLAEAREAAREARRQIRDGVDPIDARRAKLAAARTTIAKGTTFEECAKRLIEAHEAGWRNSKHRDQWRSTLETYAYPVIGKLSVSVIDTGLVLKVIEPIWKEKSETASRVRGRIEAVLDWAKARGYRSGENPARWRGHLDKLLPARSRLRKVEHHAAMAIDDLPGFMDKLREKHVVSASALEFTILTAARTGEVIQARWSEIDLKAKLWTVPAERMKAKREHRVPLSARAVDVLSKLPREDGDDCVFVGPRKGRGLSNMAMLQLLRGMLPGSNLTVHGLRSTFRDWGSERTSFASEIVEAALAHTIESKVEAAYRRGDLLEKRRRLMEAWAGFCASSSQGRAPVVSIRRPS